MPNVTITCPHCSFTFVTNHNVSSGSSSCKKCKKKHYWKLKNGALTEVKKGWHLSFINCKKSNHGKK